MSKESIQGPLSALRNAGTVCGVCLSRGSEVLVNLFPFSEARVGDMVLALDDIQGYFRNGGRSIDQMSFGYDGGCVTMVEDGEYRLIVMHMLADEVDFIAKAGRAFLADFQLNLFAEQISAGNTRLVGLIAEPNAAVNPEKSDLVKPLSPINAGLVKPKRSSLGSESEPSPTQDAKSVEASSDSEDAGESQSADSEWVPDLKELPGPPAAGVRLANHQPDSTLPPPKRPKGRR